MLVLGVLIGILGLAVLLWLVFNLAVYALPLYVAVTAGVGAYNGGSGSIFAILIGLMAGLVVLGAAQIAFAAVRSPPIRAAIALLFSAPAAMAGYHAVLGLARLGGSSAGWPEAFAIIGAIVVGGTAWGRLGGFAEPAAEQDGAASPVQSLAGLRLRDQISM
jgi:hypothetical protein